MEEYTVDDMLDDGDSEQIEEYLEKNLGFRKGYTGLDGD